MISRESYHTLRASKHVDDLNIFKSLYRRRRKWTKTRDGQPKPTSHKIQRKSVIFELFAILITILLSSSLLKLSLAEHTSENKTSVQIPVVGSHREKNQRQVRRTKRVNKHPISCPTYPTPKPLRGKKGMGCRPDPVGISGCGLDVYWTYSWAAQRTARAPNDVEFIPMRWDSTNYQAAKNSIELLVRPQVERGLALHFLGLNEPDHHLQANMAVETAIETWPIFESLGVPLVSPSCAFPNGQWMENFMGNVSALCLRVEYVGAHWYGTPSFLEFQSFMTTLYKKYQLPILITEFAPADSNAKTVESNWYTQAQVLSFMKKALPWLEQTEWIAGYAWFPFGSSNTVGWPSSLVDANMNPNALGCYYQSVRSDNILGDQSIQVYP